MLKGIPSILPPDLVKYMMEMGHGDEIVLGDRNFPATSLAQRLVRCDGIGVAELLDAILKFFPLDRHVEAPVALMAITPGRGTPVTAWDSFLEIVARHEPENHKAEYTERFAFYERARKAFVIVATGEKTAYGNIILKKGGVRE